jgi:exopolysaccharide biosynthesis WecB/TagA/CpsF family protein
VTEPSQRAILGISVHSETQQQATALLEQRLFSRRPTKLAFANAHLLNTAFEDRHLHQIMQDFLVLNDGTGVNIASRVLFGHKFPYNLNGTDFVPYFLDNCTKPLDIFLLGATEKVVQKTRAVFARRWPQHRVVGFQNGYFTDSEFVGIKQKIAALQPHMVLVAMGNGKQERLAAELVPDAAVSAWCIGALFDFLSGEVPRAPYWMRKLGSEWVFRLFVEPHRLWRRYMIGNPKFLIRVIRQRLSTK